MLPRHEVYVRQRSHIAVLATRNKTSCQHLEVLLFDRESEESIALCALSMSRKSLCANAPLEALNYDFNLWKSCGDLKMLSILQKL